MIVNIYAPKVGATTFIKQTLCDIKSQIDPSTIIFGDFNTPLTPLDRSSRQKVSKDASVLRDASLVQHMKNNPCNPPHKQN